MTSCTVLQRISNILLISPFICAFFFQKILLQISQLLFEPESLNCVQDGDNQMHYGKQNQGAEIYFCLLFLFFFLYHSKVINMEIFVKYFSGTA